MTGVGITPRTGRLLAGCLPGKLTQAGSDADPSAACISSDVETEGKVAKGRNVRRTLNVQGCGDKHGPSRSRVKKLCIY